MDWQGAWMRRPKLILGMLLLTGLAGGCRGPVLDSYGDVVDTINDTHLYLDHWYNPRLDINRAGRADWCGPINSSISPGICYLGCRDPYSDEYLYPPSNPYTLPSNTMPPPQIRKPPAQEDVPDTVSPDDTVNPRRCRNHHPIHRIDLTAAIF